MPHASTRIPNLGHLCLFLGLTFLSLIAAELVVVAAAHPHPFSAGFLDQKLQLIANVLTYLLALTAAWLLFPLLWQRNFLSGIHWNAPAARPWFIGLGLGTGIAAQAIITLIPTPKEMPIDALFHNPALIWILVGFGTLAAPLFEEILFRGFLLPGLAIAVDYLRLPKNLDALEHWRASEAFSTPALFIASLITSALFALVHAPQLGLNWAAVLMLGCVSLLLCAVRIRTRSVAASTLVHITYNLSVVLTLAVTTGGFRHLERT